MRKWILPIAAIAISLSLTGCQGTDIFDAERFMAFVREDSILRRSNRSDNPQVIYTSAGSTLTHLRYSRGGDNLVVAEGNSIVTMVGNGSNVVQIPGYKAADWNTDGTRVYAVSTANSIVSMDPDGTNVSAPIFTGTGNITSIDVNPDGSKILITYAPAVNAQIFVMDADGTDATPITGVGSVASDARWSFDGNRIAYTRTVGASVDIYAINPDGTGHVPLANTVETERHPAYMSNGRLFYSRGTAAAQIWEMEGDGTLQQVYQTGSAPLTYPDAN